MSSEPMCANWLLVLAAYTALSLQVPGVYDLTAGYQAVHEAAVHLGLVTRRPRLESGTAQRGQVHIGHHKAPQRFLRLRGTQFLKQRILDVRVYKKVKPCNWKFKEQIIIVL